MSIYKDCDIRGIYGVEFDCATVYRIGRAIGAMMAGQRLAVGGDVRLSTPEIRRSLLRGLVQGGARPLDLGTLPTPAFYYALSRMPFAGGVMITASHNPARYNGLKLMFGPRPIQAEVIREIKRRADAVQDTDEGPDPIVPVLDILPEYENMLLRHFPAGRLKVVIDSGNGAMSEVAPRVFRQLGYQVVPLYCTFDGSFPNRDPNPAVYAHLRDLCQSVRENGADLGLAFDGDGDRVVFVDNLGRTLASERSLVLLIQACLKGQPGPVVYDQKSSTIVRKAIEASQGTPLMERSGHTFIKTRFLDTNALLAGEVSGHFFFRELGYDDGLFAALTMARLIGEQPEPLSELADRIPVPLITPDIRVPCPYDRQDVWLGQVRQLGRDYPINEMDGVRVEFGNGWLLVRKSVTEAGVTVRIEADSDAAMQRIKRLLLTVLPEVRDYLT